MIRKPILFRWHFFQKLKISCLCSPSFILCSSFFLLWPSCFLKFLHISCSFTLVPSFFSLKSQNSAFLENCNKYFLVILNSIILGGLSKILSVKMAPSKLNKKIFWGKWNSIILGGFINQRLGLPNLACVGYHHLPRSR